jgi:AmmeMemoRadiSam system protein A
VQRVGLEAAVADARFPPLTSAELDEVEIEISVLSPLQPIDGVSEIEVGRHGVILVKGDKQGLFLPQVASEQGWDREEVLANLCFKAGIDDGNCWQEGAQFYVFTAEVFAEGE